MQTHLSKIIYSLIDLTSLNDSDNPETIMHLCSKASGPLGHVAAVCVYPQFVKQCATLLSDSPTQLATVANFPHGTSSIKQVRDVIIQSIQDGAQEIDVVFPYASYLSGEKKAAIEFIQQCKQACGNNLLKVILETGAFPDMQMIKTASQDAIEAGADFIKTSTGKIQIGATLPAATAILMTIKELSPTLNRVVGFKVSGGVCTLEQATQYYSLVSEIMGPDWISPQTFRIGASQLVDELNHH